MVNRLPYALGCPAWSIPEWRGRFFPAATATRDLLTAYSKVFNTVEGNSFFYALPPTDTVHRWAEETADGFQFCMKVPRDLSHASRLVANGPIYDALIARLDILAAASRLGPTFLQLPPSFDPSRLEELHAFIRAWPRSFPLAVEVRHETFFNPGRGRSDFYAMLRQASVDRVAFDSRALFSGPPSDAAEEMSQQRKPNKPVEWTVTGMRPFVRFVGRNDIEKVDPWQSELVRAAVEWIREGRRPYLFMHTPDDTFAPQLCRRFHALMREWLPDLPNLQFPEINTQLRLL